MAGAALDLKADFIQRQDAGITFAERMETEEHAREFNRRPPRRRVSEASGSIHYARAGRARNSSFSQAQAARRPMGRTSVNW